MRNGCFCRFVLLDAVLPCVYSASTWLLSASNVYIFRWWMFAVNYFDGYVNVLCQDIPTGGMVVGMVRWEERSL